MIKETGTIHSHHGQMMLRMWTVDVPPGKRPLQHHSHVQFEMMRVRRGEGVYTTEKKSYPMREGDMFFFGSEEMHCITDVGADGLEILNLQFAPEYVWESTSETMRAEHANFCFAHSENFENRIPADRAEELSALFLKIKEELEGKRMEYALAAKTFLTQMIVTLLRDFRYADETSPVASDHIRCVRRALVYIDRHLADKLSLEDIAAEAGISPAYFSTVFRKVSRIGLWEYITSKRIDRAIRLLTAPDRSETVLEIAARCGYNNTANFNKAFKKRIGMTPGEYLRTDHMPL